MARSIDYRSTLAFPAEKVFAAMTDEEYLRARLRELGGPGSALLEHEARPDGARYKLKQGLSEQDLPPIVGKVMQRRHGDPAHRVAAGARARAATAATSTSRSPGSRRRRPGRCGWPTTAPAASSRCTRTSTVKVPLIGGKIEEIVAGQVRRLLEAETAFTVRWLESHR